MNRRYSFMVAALFMGAGLFFSSCHSCQRPVPETDELGDTLCVEPFVYADTLPLVGSTVYQRLSVAFPLASDSTVLADSLRAWLCEAVQAHYAPVFGDEAAPFVYQGDSRNAEALLAAAGQAGTAFMKSELEQMAGEGFETAYNNDYSVELHCQTPRYVTFDTKYEIFTGGAHGAYIYSGVTFRRRDGAEMGWNMLDLSQKQQLLTLIKEELKGYFSEGAGKEITTDEQLYELLMLWDDPDTPENELEYGLPLPSTQPCLLPGGMFFCYQQYEIAPYAAGLPMALIPYDVIAPLLSAEGRELAGVQ